MKTINTLKSKKSLTTFEFVNTSKRLSWNEKRRYSNSLQLRFI